MAIPIKNIYWLLCYAWKYTKLASPASVEAVKGENTANLLTELLVEGTRHILKKGLDRGYLQFTEPVSSLRGKLLIAESHKRGLVTSHKLLCQFDELSHDILPNQILKSTLVKLMCCPEIDSAQKQKLRQIFFRLVGVRTIELQASHFRIVQLGTNNARYALLMDVCKLVNQCLLPTECRGIYRFKDFRRDDAFMNRLFEDFVRNFFKSELPQLSVGRERIWWDLSASSTDSERILPWMETDTVIRDKSRVLIVETKYYGRILAISEHGKAILKSENLYQLMSYLTNYRAKEWSASEVCGLLLYASDGTSLDVSYVIQGHAVRVVALDLSQDWQDCKRFLLSLSTQQN